MTTREGTVNKTEQLLREYRDAPVRIDELSLQLGETLRFTRIGWDCVNPDCTSEAPLDPINEIAGRIGDAMPRSITETRPPPKRI